MLDALLATLGALAILASILAKCLHIGAGAGSSAQADEEPWRADAFPGNPLPGRPCHRRPCRTARSRIGTSAIPSNK